MTTLTPANVSGGQEGGKRRGVSVKKLKRALKKAGLKTTGKKATLRARAKKAHLKLKGGAGGPDDEPEVAPEGGDMDAGRRHSRRHRKGRKHTRRH